MFGGKEKPQDYDTIPSTPTTPTMNSTPKPKSQNHNKDQITAYLGPDVHIEGKLSFQNSVLIEGRFNGEIESGGSLIIGENAEVDAKIITKTIAIKGKVKGSIEASERVELQGHGELQGDIVTPSLQMDETVFFQGSCSMPSASGKRNQAKQKENEVQLDSKKETVEEIVDVVGSTKD
jgi:cytoskeletal protein CcmA (bactofilin family)